MELGEELDESSALAGRLRLGLPLEMPAERPDVVRGAVTADIVDDLAFDQPAGGVGLLDFRQRRIGDERAAVALQRDHAGDARDAAAPRERACARRRAWPQGRLR